MNRRRGFTLTELVVTASVMAVIGGFAAFNVIGQLPKWRLEQAQYKLLSDLRKARMLSVARAESVTVQLNDGARTYTLSHSGGSENLSIASIQGITMVSTPDTLTFNPNGTMTCSGEFGIQYITLANEYGTRKVQTIPGGQVDLWVEEEEQ